MCLFALALVLLGVGMFLHSRKFAPKVILRVVGFAVLFAAFLGGTLLFRKSSPTDELATALDFARSGDPTKQRQAMESFRKYPDAQSSWLPLVIPILQQPDHVARNTAVALLGDTHARDAVGPLGTRLSVEPEDDVRESVVRALRAIGDPSAVHALADAATKEQEPDLTVAMGLAAFELAADGHDADLRLAADALVKVMVDDGSPHAARRDASDGLRAHVLFDPPATDDAMAAAWWHDHRDATKWQVAKHQFALAAGG